MEKIASFTIDHIKLKPGVYVSRKDHVGDSVITTFDLRMTSPNDEPVMNTAEVHTIEHLGATFLRNHEEWKDKTVYFGPMGCRTGFYLLLAGDYSSNKATATTEPDPHAYKEPFDAVLDPRRFMTKEEEALLAQAEAARAKTGAEQTKTAQTKTRPDQDHQS